MLTLRRLCVQWLETCEREDESFGYLMTEFFSGTGYYRVSTSASMSRS